MHASEKDTTLEQARTSLFGFDRKEHIESDTCIPPPIGCGKPVGEFVDDLSAKEFSISGLCQACQDNIFAD